MDIDKTGGFIYISDNANNCVRRVEINDMMVTTIAEGIGSPMGIAVGPTAIYVTSSINHVIYKISTESSPAVISILTGTYGMLF